MMLLAETFRNAVRWGAAREDARPAAATRGKSHRFNALTIRALMARRWMAPKSLYRSKHSGIAKPCLWDRATDLGPSLCNIAKIL